MLWFVALPSESKCKFINLIRTRQKYKNHLRKSLNMKSINEITQWKIWMGRCDVLTCKLAPEAPCAVFAQYTEYTEFILHVFTHEPIRGQEIKKVCMNYRLITAYLLLRVNLDKIMHAGWDFDASSARTRRVSVLDKHQNWGASALFCLNSRAQSKYAVVNLIHTRCKQTYFVFYYVINKTF